MKIELSAAEAKTLIATISQARAALFKRNRELADRLDKQWDLIVRRIEKSEVTEDDLQPGLQGRNFDKN
jgi:hypothetical protein